MRKKLVYVAGPITHPEGQHKENAHRACVIGEEMYLKHDIIPLIPHLSVMWLDVEGSKSPEWGYDEWLDIDFNMIQRCDGLFRMEGYSPGADREVEFAKRIFIPVFENMTSMGIWAKQ